MILMFYSYSLFSPRSSSYSFKPVCTSPLQIFKMFSSFWLYHFWDERPRLEPNSDYATLGDKSGEKVRLLFFREGEGPEKVFIEVTLFVDILIAEYVLRGIVQREQHLKSKILAFRKLAADEDDGREEEHHQELQDLLRRYAEAEHKLYIAETRFPPGTLQKSYNALRQNPTWYLRQELVQDCARRGGCCSRSCGCCQKRHEIATRSKGLGHCTPSCGCCSSERGFEYSAEERRSFVEDLESQLYDDNPFYLVHVACLFFLLPQKEARKKGLCKKEIPKWKRTINFKRGSRQWWKGKGLF